MVISIPANHDSRLKVEICGQHSANMKASSERSAMVDTRVRIQSRDTNLLENANSNLVTNWHRTAISIWK